jgi:hypothetical protein
MNDIFGLIATVAYFAAFGILYNIGDASHVSYKTLQLTFVQLLIQVPAVGLDGFSIIIDIARYVWNVMVIMAIYRQFTTVGCLFHATYSRTLDSFPLHWMLVLLATAVPMLLVFVPENGTVNAVICTPAVFKDEPWACSYEFLWSVNYCLMPLMFLPQLLVCYKLSRENTSLNMNVKLFLLCMIVNATAVLILYLSITKIWEITTPACILTIFLLGLPFCGWSWVCNRFCPNTNQDISGNTAGDADVPKEGERSGSAMVIEEYDLPTINAINNPIV